MRKYFTKSTLTQNINIIKHLSYQEHCYPVFHFVTQVSYSVKYAPIPFQCFQCKVSVWSVQRTEQLLKKTATQCSLGHGVWDMLITVISQSKLWPPLYCMLLLGTKLPAASSTKVSLASDTCTTKKDNQKEHPLQSRPQCLGYVAHSHITVNALAFTE